MAGEVGIEPTNAGIKIRCLTTWRLPSGALAADDVIDRVPTFDSVFPPATQTRVTDGARACERCVFQSAAANAGARRARRVRSRTPQTHSRPNRSSAHSAKHAIA